MNELVEWSRTGIGRTSKYSRASMGGIACTIDITLAHLISSNHNSEPIFQTGDDLGIQRVDLVV